MVLAEYILLESPHHDLKTSDNWLNGKMYISHVGIAIDSSEQCLHLNQKVAPGKRLFLKLLYAFDRGLRRHLLLQEQLREPLGC